MFDLLQNVLIVGFWILMAWGAFNLVTGRGSAADPQARDQTG
jgi:hypothetical protein